MPRSFTARIHKVGINPCVDVPASISNKLVKVKGYIRVKGTINGVPFAKNLVPVRNGPYRLFVDQRMLKGARVQVGDTATFSLMADDSPPAAPLPMRPEMRKALREGKVEAAFDALSDYRRKDLLKYLGRLKDPAILRKHLDRLVALLHTGERNIRLP